MIYFSSEEDFDKDLKGNGNFYLRINDTTLYFAEFISKEQAEFLVNFLNENFMSIIEACGTDIVEMLTDDQKRYLLHNII